MFTAGTYLIEIDQRELNTILSALRLYQHEGCPDLYGMALVDDRTQPEETLGVSEIDELCERVNSPREADPVTAALEAAIELVYAYPDKGYGVGEHIASLRESLEQIGTKFADDDESDGALIDQDPYHAARDLAAERE